MIIIIIIIIIIIHDSIRCAPGDTSSLARHSLFVDLSVLAFLWPPAADRWRSDRLHRTRFRPTVSTLPTYFCCNIIDLKCVVSFLFADFSFGN